MSSSMYSNPERKAFDGRLSNNVCKQGVVAYLRIVGTSQSAGAVSDEQCYRWESAPTMTSHHLRLSKSILSSEASTNQPSTKRLGLQRE